jgi:hypothetical protein
VLATKKPAVNSLETNLKGNRAKNNIRDLVWFGQFLPFCLSKNGKADRTSRLIVRKAKQADARARRLRVKKEGFRKSSCTSLHHSP